jgi:GH15 family glucan-1,4-alpha-glucosidase
LHHKYQPDGAIGSTWHPMIQEDSPELNIQEDETAAVIVLFNELYKISPEEPELKDFYMELILPATEFIASYIDRHTMLPHASYDLWEETFLSSTYSTSVVIGALRISIELAEVFDPAFSTAHWSYSLQTITDNFHKYFSSEGQYYMKGLRLHHRGEITFDTRLDASTMMALLRFKPVDSNNAAVVGTVKAVEDQLFSTGHAGGVVRYQNDSYMKDSAKSNPWFICTLWLAQYYVMTHDMEKANQLLNWVYNNSTSTKLLSEQVHPYTSEQLSVSPLVWSHAELVETLISIYED